MAARARARAARGARLHLLVGVRPGHRQLRGLRVQRPHRVRVVRDRRGRRHQLAAIEAAPRVPARLPDGGRPGGLGGGAVRRRADRTAGARGDARGVGRPRPRGARLPPPAHRPVRPDVRNRLAGVGAHRLPARRPERGHCRADAAVLHDARLLLARARARGVPLGARAESARDADRELSLGAAGRRLPRRAPVLGQRGRELRARRDRPRRLPAAPARLRGRAVSRPQVQIDGVWKSYPAWSAGSRTLRGIVSRRIPLLAHGSDRRWVLRDVSLEAEAGQAVGLIGQNGAGKSTLLRLASGVGRADRGMIHLPERTASVLSFDSWFELDLTGRENAMTALVVNGWRRAEARDLIAGVLEFAELESFADAPVRTYSEGMKLRLAFGVVAQLDPDVLLIDEVISVGDLRFQQKCMDRLREMRDRGMTLIMASHGLEQVQAECDRAVWLQAGVVRSFGDPAEVIEEYRSAMASATLERTPAAAPGAVDGGLELRRNRFGNQEMTIDSVQLLTEDRGPLEELRSGRPLRIALRLSTANNRVDDPIVGVAIHRASDGL